MRVLIISDNHGEEKILSDIQLEEKCDINIHLGDSEFPYSHSEMELFHRVTGNCDNDELYPSEGYLEDVRIYFTHGHKHKIKGDSRKVLAESAESKGAKYALYGHSHVAKVERVGNIFCINPGSISDSRNNVEESYAVLDTAQDHLTFKNRRGEVIEAYDLNQIY